ncbi:MFS transporter [Amycolatopsis viridis]|uniref:MFS family arabinose efflux permease n=1 Tax=Amycolatopsis viridis TaxID=185678 RepID=A0ABX0STT9_9PSEU|nr:MFS transporter [Amycolatopsis viridis]NIH80366.1 putative MFS family arabinose efflux permease [Amycolatopsis viridis]
MTIRQASNDTWAWRLVILAVGTFVLGVDGFVMPGLLPEISSDLAVSVATAGQLTTVFAVSYAVGSPVIATLTGRLDRRIVIGAGMVSFLLGMVLQAAGPTYGVVLAGRVVAALGAAAFQANAFAVAGVLAPPDRRARAFAVIGAGFSLAAVLGVPFGLLIGQVWGWRGTLWTIVALAVVAAVLAGLFVPSITLPATTMRDRLTVLVNPRILVLLAVSALVLAPLFLLTAYASAVVGISSPGSDNAILVALLVYGAGSFLGNRLVGLFVDRFASLSVIVTGLGIVALASGLLAVVQHWFVPTLAVLFVLGVLGSSLFIPQQSRVFDAGGDLATVALSLNGSMNYVGTALGAGLGGVVLATAGPLWLGPAAAVLAAAVIAIAVITAPERRTRTTTLATSQ